MPPFGAAHVQPSQTLELVEGAEGIAVPVSWILVDRHAREQSGSSSDLTSGSSSSGSSVPNTPVDTPSGHVDGSSGHAQKKKFRKLCLDESTTSAAFVTCMTKHRPNPTSDKIARWTEYFNEKHKPKSIQRRTGGQVVGNDHHYTPAY
ncbi:hypothetical protein APHAL10511_000324 [Amanita phalloides]|nr:hypothetical protein APHAL10511_000324 [Amanita phalloides]